MANVTIGKITYINGIPDKAKNKITSAIDTPRIFTVNSDAVTYLQTLGILDGSQKLQTNVVTSWSRVGTYASRKQNVLHYKKRVDFNQPNPLNPTLKVIMTGDIVDIDAILGIIGFQAVNQVSGFRPPSGTPDPGASQDNVEDE